MFNVIDCALIALSSISGRTLQNKNKINVSNENIKTAFEIHEKYCSDCVDHKITNVSDVYGLSGIDEFALFQFNNDSYVLIDKYLNKEIETGYIKDSPYFGNLDNCVIKTESEHFVYDYVSNSFFSWENGSNLESYYLRSGDWSDYYSSCVSSENPQATFIANAHYFDNLNSRFGDNDSNICGIIASQIIFGYYDTFANDNIVDEIYDIKGDYLSLNSNYGDSPGTDLGNLNFNNDFRDLLVNKAIECNNDNPVVNGMTNMQLYRLVDSYLTENNISNTVNIYPISFLYSNIAENLIDNNTPFIAALSDHFVVVYGYDSDNFYVSVGWADNNGNDTGSIPREWFTNFSSPFILRFSIDDHVHSNNYYNQTTFGLYCGCGFHHSNRLIMNPEDWGFAEQYFFTNKTVNHNKDGLQFISKRLRTGYIQSAVINLSPRRVGAGAAIFDIFLNHEIYELNVQLAWWSSNELETYGYADLIEHRINDDELTWNVYADDYLENILPHGYMNRINKQYFLRPNIDGIRFDIQNQAVGNQNRGRLSIGTIIFDYYL